MAERTLASAVRDMKAGDYNQAGEYAVKALLYGIVRPVRGHSITRLLRELSELVQVGGRWPRMRRSSTSSTRLLGMWTRGPKMRRMSTTRGAMRRSLWPPRGGFRICKGGVDAVRRWREGLRARTLELARKAAEVIGGTVFLIGSFARGDFSEDSDVDLLATNRFDGPPHRSCWGLGTRRAWRSSR